MTVLAFDGNILATDSRATMGTQLLTDNITKLHEVNVMGLGKCAVAFCGALNIIGPWKHHLKVEGISPLEGFDCLEEVYADAMILTNKGKLTYTNVFGHWYDVDFYPYALGSGQDLALNHMHNGATAIEAVKAACKSELSCGGNIQTYDWRTKQFRIITV